MNIDPIPITLFGIYLSLLFFRRGIERAVAIICIAIWISMTQDLKWSLSTLKDGRW